MIEFDYEYLREGVFVLGVFCGSMSTQTAKLIDGTLRLKAEIDVRGIRTLYEGISLLAVVAGLAVFVSGFFMFAWWMPFALWLLMAPVAVGCIAFLRFNRDAALPLHFMFCAGVILFSLWSWSLVFA